MCEGAWVTQSVKCLSLGFGSGHDLWVCEFDPRVRLHGDIVGPALILSSLLPLPLSLSSQLSK